MLFTHRREILEEIIPRVAKGAEKEKKRPEEEGFESSPEAVTDDDIACAMELFDKDRTGTITEKEFRQGIELMKTFG